MSSVPRLEDLGDGRGATQSSEAGGGEDDGVEVVGRGQAGVDVAPLQGFHYKQSALLILYVCCSDVLGASHVHDVITLFLLQLLPHTLLPYQGYSANGTDRATNVYSV